MFDDVHLGHSLLSGGPRDVVLEVLVAVIDGLHSVPLPRIPPGHGHRHRGGDGVAVHGVVDHSRLARPARHLARLVTKVELALYRMYRLNTAGETDSLSQPSGQETLTVSCRAGQT